MEKHDTRRVGAYMTQSAFHMTSHQHDSIKTPIGDDGLHHVPACRCPSALGLETRFAQLIGRTSLAAQPPLTSLMFFHQRCQGLVALRLRLTAPLTCQYLLEHVKGPRDRTAAGRFACSPKRASSLSVHEWTERLVQRQLLSFGQLFNFHHTNA